MKILAVDDDPIILELMSGIIEHFGGHSLLTAMSGADALAIARAEGDIDCFLLDIQMPGMDGIQLCHQLRSMPAFLKAPILMITAMSDKRYIDAAFAAGASDYVNKPFEIPELRARISMVEELVSSRAKSNSKVFVGPKRKKKASNPLSALRAPFAIPDVEGVIEEQALENYLTSLTRSELFGSTVVAFSIRRIKEHFTAMAPFDFQCMIVDVAEAISDCMDGHQFLMAYLGNGTYGCVIEDGWPDSSEKFIDRVQLLLHHMDLHNSNGQPLNIRIAAGASTQLAWRSGRSAVDALADAFNSAGQEAERIEKSLDEFWFLEKSA